MPKKINQAEELLKIHLKEKRLGFGKEVRLVSERRWRWDFVVADLAIEIQGGVYKQGGHTRGEGYTKDCEKMRAAIMAGYKPVYFTTKEVMNGTAIDWILAYLKVQ